MEARAASGASVATAWSERCRQLSEPIIEACAVTPVNAGSAQLAKAIGKHLPEWSFHETLCRGGWYRLGGVIGESGTRISDNVEEWASNALEERGGDLASLLEDYAGSMLRATHVTGRTHFLVAPARIGGTTEYLQLEVEDLQETYAPPLFQHTVAPALLDELIDSRCCSGDKGSSTCTCDGQRCGTPLGVAQFRFRRLTHVGDLLARMRTQALEPQPIHRFVADWEASSAGTTAFCNHWVLALREHLDRYQQRITQATPVPAFVGELPKFEAREGTSGLSLQAALTRFDRAVGYPMAWFFSLVTARGDHAIPHWLPSAVAADAAAGFSYLPERDIGVIRKWLLKPYAC